MKLNNNLVFFTGGGTAGHIYPGLAVADQLKTIAASNNHNIKICWIGCSKGMDKKIVETALGPDGKPTASKFYGIPSGKLRRYFSLKIFSVITTYCVSVPLLFPLQNTILPPSTTSGMSTISYSCANGQFLITLSTSVMYFFWS